MNIKLMAFLSMLSVSVWLLTPTTLHANPQALKPVGQAEMSWLMFRVYRATLKTADGNYQPNRYPIALEIQYLRPIERQVLLDTTQAQWQRLGVKSVDQQRWLAQLAKLWPDIRSGDTLTVHVDAKQRNRFYHNGRELGGINDPRFGEQFLAIWLSPKTSRPELRQQLITPSFNSSTQG